MTLKKIPLGPIKVGGVGQSVRATNRRVLGEIIKVRVVYNKDNSNSETSLTIKTIEEEKIVELPNWNEDIVLYPRHSFVNQRMAQGMLGPNNPTLERFYSTDKLIIEVESRNFNVFQVESGDKAEERQVIDNIIITVRE